MVPDIPVYNEVPSWAKWLPVGPEPSCRAFVSELKHSSVVLDDFDTNQVHRLSIFGPQAVEWNVGKAGQIYSIYDGKYELIANQQPGYSEWNDAVIQGVVYDLDTNDTSQDSTFHHIHQAGCYKTTDDPTYYSPLLAEAWVRSEGAYYCCVWAQLAHIPSAHKSYVLFYQKLRPIVGGFMEVTYGVQNFGNEVTYDFMAAPWFPLRQSSVPFQCLARNGKIDRYDSLYPETQIELKDTDGFSMQGRWKDDKKTDLWGTSIVFGKHDRSFFRFGKCRKEELDLTIGSVQRYVTILPQRSAYIRFYIGIGDFKDLRSRSLELVKSVGFADDIVTYFPQMQVKNQYGWWDVTDFNSVTSQPYHDRPVLRIV